MPQLQVQLERPSYSPGETIRAWARALEGGESRAGMALVRYVERTDDYTEVAWHKLVRLWDGDVGEGQSFAFELPLPADAKPGYRGNHGSLAWDVLVRSDEFGRDSTASQAFELIAPEGGYELPPAAPSEKAPPAWTKGFYYATPAIAGGVGYMIARIPGAVAGIALAGSGAVLDRRRRARHFDIEPLRPVRRGESVRATVRMIDASKVKGALEAELSCVERFAYRSHSSRGGSSRKVGEEPLWRERIPLAAGRSVDLQVPAEMPFSHSGMALSFVWTLAIRERRENATDRIAETRLEVVP